MKQNTRSRVLLLLGATVLMAGCSGSCVEQTGSLSISITPSSLESRTILPPVSMDVASYLIEGDGPSDETFSVTATTTGATVEQLLAGTWDITVSARNATDTPIGTGTGSATVVVRSTASVAITVLPFSGDGTLSLSVTWPGGLIAAPAVTALLTPVGQSAESLAPTVGATSATAVVTRPSGYYTLALELLDGAVKVWGRTEAVRLLADTTTTASFDLAQADLDLGGALNVTVVPDMNDPLTVAFAGDQTYLLYGNDMTVTATVSGTPTYQWYLDGTLLPGQTAAAIALGATVDLGFHTLSLVAQTGTELGSLSLPFTVVSALLPVTITVVGGSYPGEITWTLEDDSETVVASGGPYATPGATVTSVNLPPGQYTLYAVDGYGDGWNGGTITFETGSTVCLDAWTFSTGFTAQTIFAVWSGE